MIVEKALRYVPPVAVRALGRWQFRFAPLRWATERYADRLTIRQGTIAHGAGAGLLFDATGGQPGFLLGTAEPAEQDRLRESLRPGAVFYDIGANIGFFSTIAARIVGATGAVYAFEPFPASARQARLNADLNEFSHVTVVETAVSDASGTRTMDLGAGSTTHRLGDTNSPEGLAVRVVTIDGWRVATGAPGPDVVMIDVEGAELAVLNGMLATIRRYRPTILCEVHWIGGEIDHFIDSELRPLGYDFRALGREGGFGTLERWHAMLTPLPG